MAEVSGLRRSENIAIAAGGEAFREAASGRPGRSPRGSRVARQPGNKCGSAIGGALIKHAGTERVLRARRGCRHPLRAPSDGTLTATDLLACFEDFSEIPL